MSCVPVVRAAALLALAFTAAPVLAQQTAQQFIHAGLRATGLSDADIATWGVIKSSAKTVDKGLVIDTGWVQPLQEDPSSNNPGTLVVLVLNPTGQPWCIRPTGAVVGTTVKSAEVTQHNFVVEPGTSARFAHAVVLPDASRRYQYKTAFAIAAWQPDFSQPFASQCKAAEPEYLDEWLASSSYRSYEDFAAEQEFNDMVEAEREYLESTD